MYLPSKVQRVIDIRVVTRKTSVFTLNYSTWLCNTVHHKGGYYILAIKYSLKLNFMMGYCAFAKVMKVMTTATFGRIYELEN